MLVEKYSSQVRVVTSTDKVYKDECVFSYANPFSPDGLYVCLNRFIGVCKDLLPLYYSKSQSNLYLKLNFVLTRFLIYLNRKLLISSRKTSATKRWRRTKQGWEINRKLELSLVVINTFELVKRSCLLWSLNVL